MRFIILANQFIGDKLSTGGDIVAFEVTKRLKINRVILAPANIQPALQRVVSEAEWVATDGNVGPQTSSTIIGGVQTVISYLSRAWRSYGWLQKNAQANDKIYLTGDFICNTLPAFMLKMQRPTVKVFANFYHRNPPPSRRPGNPTLVSWASRFLQTISLWLIKAMAEQVFVLSEIGKQELVKEGFKESKLVISGAGADLAFAHKYHNLNKQAHQIVFIGRINNTKGVFELIEMLEKLVAQKLVFTCKLIGAGSEQDLTKLKDLINKCRVGKYVEIMGYVSDTAKYQTLAQSRFLALPSKEEGFGIVVLEALAVGVPVVCFDLPALRTLFGHYPQVTFIPVGDYQGFTQAMAETLTLPFKPFKVKFATWESVYKLQAKYLI